MKIICPPHNWENPISVTESEVSLVKEVSKRLGLVCKASGDKVYVGVSDRSIPANPPKPTEGILLDCPYYSQRDSQVSGQASRSCFSSSMAMVTKMLKPGALSGSKNADDEYLQRVFVYGDTTDPNAQIKALNHMGIIGHYAQNMSWSDVDKELEAGRPVGVGWLIWGNVNAPSGGGHWSVIVGKQGSAYRVHDPYGECDLLNGGYIHSNGKARAYSAKNFGLRWMVEGPGTGWGMRFKAK
jgi:hypothetical protein